MRGQVGKARVYRKLDGLRESPPIPRTLHELLAVHERVIIIKTLHQHNFSRTKAAAALGVSRNYLWRRMKILQIDFAALPRTTPGRPRKRTAR